MSPELQAALERARNHIMTPQEKFLQRVSWCFGMQDYDSPNPMSKRRVAEILIEQQGYPLEWIDLIPAAPAAPLPCTASQLSSELGGIQPTNRDDL